MPPKTHGKRPELIIRVRDYNCQAVEPMNVLVPTFILGLSPNVRKTFPNRAESNVFRIFDVAFAGGFPESSRYNTRYRRRELRLEKGIYRYWGRPIKADTL